ncbi:unnamed protein product [Lathyrus sativus]|nr:unnamed protein product [Lathyrus sativus]
MIIALTHSLILIIFLKPLGKHITDTIPKIQSKKKTPATISLKLPNEAAVPYQAAVASIGNNTYKPEPNQASCKGNYKLQATTSIFYLSRGVLKWFLKNE